MYKRPLLNELWDELDSVVYRLKTDGWEDGPLSAEDQKNWGIDIGRAQGIAYAIALTYDLLNPNVEWVREEAMRRWEAHLEHPTPYGTDERVDLGRLGIVRSRGVHGARGRGAFAGADGKRQRRLGGRTGVGKVLRVAGKQGER